MATTRGPCSTISGTRTFSTRSGTPTWHPTASRTFGGTDNGESRIAPRIPRHANENTGSRALASCASLACAPSARPRCRPPSSAGSACAWEARAPGESRYCCRFYHPLDHFDWTASLRCQRGLDVLDHGFKLLVRQAFELAVQLLAMTRADRTVGRVRCLGHFNFKSPTAQSGTLISLMDISTNQIVLRESKYEAGQCQSSALRAKRSSDSCTRFRRPMLSCNNGKRVTE